MSNRKTTLEMLKKSVDRLIGAALKEDLGEGDVTVKALVPPKLKGTAEIRAKAEGRVSGLGAAHRVFEKVNRHLTIRTLVKEGAKIRPGDVLMTVKGNAGSLLEGERTALNFLQHLSGIATATARFVDAIAGTNAVILDTRKTIPGLRVLEKAAVKAGGGANHRMGLHDMILIKDNHLTVLDAEDEVEAVRIAVPRALARAPRGMKVEVEVTGLDAALEAARCGAHMVLLDNMTPRTMKRVMEALTKEFGTRRPLAEASGGVTLRRVRKVAESGVDRISVGALTHSAPALDIAMYILFHDICHGR